MRVSLKSIHERRGEETRNFDAVILVDGLRVGLVDNSGQGGPNRYSFDATPGGKPVGGPFTDEMGERMRANRARFEEAALEDAASERLSTDGTEWEDSLIWRVLAQVENGKRARKAGKQGYGVMLEEETLDGPTSAMFGDRFFSNTVHFRFFRSEVTARAWLDSSPEARVPDRITMYDCQTGAVMAIVYESEAFITWQPPARPGRPARPVQPA